MRTFKFSDEENKENFNLKETLFLFWQRKWLVFNILVITLTITSVWAFRLPDEYQSSAQVLMEELPRPVLRTQTEDIASSEITDEYYLTQRALFTSHPVLIEVVEQLGLQEKMVKSGFVKKPGEVPEPLDLEAAIEELKKITRVDFSNLIYTVTVTYPDPFAAASIANAIIKTYVKQYLEGRLYLSKEIKELFPEEAEQLEKYTTQGQLKELSRDELIAKLPTVQADPTVKTLQQKKYFLENEIDTSSHRYKDKHPKMIELKASLRFVSERLTARQEAIADSLKEKLAGKFQESTIKILHEATIPKSPSGPNRLNIILIAGLIALSVSFGLVVLLDTLDDRINSQEDIERYIQLPFLGSIFKIKKVKDESKRMLIVLHEPLSETAEAFKNLRVGINFATAPEHRRMLLVTSTTPQEGKSFVAANLAISKAQDGKKVLLVDADLRRPNVHKLFDLENKVGLSNILTTDTPMESAIRKASLDNLEIVTSGPVSPNPPEIFTSKAMKEFLKKLQGKYDTVIFDAPPAHNVPDALVLGNIIDSTLYVIQAHKASYKLISKTKDRLKENGVRIIGSILNNLEISKDKAYYYDYQSYGYTYSKREEKK
jgi:capsular exopolysaccharide synthesis family protein